MYIHIMHISIHASSLDAQFSAYSASKIRVKVYVVFVIFTRFELVIGARCVFQQESLISLLKIVSIFYFYHQ